MTGSPKSSETIAFSFDGIPALVGREFVGAWFAIDEAKIASFAEATYADELLNEFEDSLYPSRLIEGFHLLALLERLVDAVLRFPADEIAGWNYGLDRVRFVSPVTATDRIRVRGTIDEVRPRGPGYVVRFDCTVDVEGRDEPGFVAQWWVYWLPAHPEQP